MSELTAVITGASSGLGLWTARRLSAHVDRLALVCRDPARAQAAVERVREVAPRALCVDVWLADLSSIAATRRLAAKLRGAYPVVDVLVNNAGAVYGPHQLSVDGIELHLATNYVGHFLLTTLLLDSIARAAQGRIVNLTSSLHAFGRIRFGDLAYSRWYHLVPAYAQSKLAIVLGTIELARRTRHLPLTVNCIDPGLVRTDIWRGAGPIQQLFARPLQWIALDPEEASAAIAELAVAPTFKGRTGELFVRTAPRRPGRRARDAQTAALLWERSLEWLEADERSALDALLKPLDPEGVDR